MCGMHWRWAAAAASTSAQADESASGTHFRIEVSAARHSTACFRASSWYRDYAKHTWAKLEDELEASSSTNLQHMLKFVPSSPWVDESSSLLSSLA